MKSIIESDGTMRIEPETETDHYTLKQWAKDFVNESVSVIVDTTGTKGEKPKRLTIKLRSFSLK